jgi:beta-glucanase (GH16 family)
VWSDEFEGTTLNTSNWTAESIDPPKNGELQFYTTNLNDPLKGNIWVEQGNLVIAAYKENRVGANNRNYYFTSGRIKSQGKREFQYGRIEARMKLPKGQGMWPAFWMMGSNIGSAPWPANGEIDIMEAKGRFPNQYYATVHWGNPNQFPSLNFGKMQNTGDLTAGYNTFGMEWEPGSMKFFINNQFWFDFAYPVGERPFDQPNFFILNLALGGWFDEYLWPRDADLPAFMLVDYVRVYQRD